MKYLCGRTTVELCKEKAYIIKRLFSGHMHLATLLKTFNFTLAFLRMLLKSSSNINLLAFLTPNSFSDLLLFVSAASFYLQPC